MSRPKLARQLSTPTISVVIPVYNSANVLESCLASLAKSKFDRFEVLIVDDGSTEAIEPLAQKHGFAYTRIEGPGGPARARNIGATLVAGRYLVFVDADVCVHPDALTRFAARFAEDAQLAAVIGSYDESPADSSFISQYKNLFHHFVHHQCDGQIGTFWTGCGAIRRDLFLSFGGFDEKRYRRPAIEDIELGTWLTAAGSKIVLDSRIKAKHLKRWTFWNLLKTDVFDRGVPWTRLMLRANAAANTLNVRPAQRISVALAFITALLAVLGFSWPVAWLGALLAGAAVFFINREFYRFFAERKGISFALRVVPFHWLYFFYCGLSLILGAAFHVLADEREYTRPALASQIVAGSEPSE